MAYRLDSQRIINVDPPADAAAAYQPPPLPSRGFGFSNLESPCKQVATFHPHRSPHVESPGAAGARSAAPTELSATTSVSPTNLFPGEDSPSRASKRVGINPRNEHTDWDFLKNRGLGDSSRLAATEPGVILSTFPRGMAHVPERRPLTEAEVNHFAFLVSNP
jgi:hypothetical protein